MITNNLHAETAYYFYTLLGFRFVRWDKNLEKMNRMRDKLPNANKWCHIYTDIDGVTNIYNTKTNETYRIIPETFALGFQLERHKDGELKARNTISFDELRILSDLAGSNHLLQKLDGKGEEANEA